MVVVGSDAWSNNKPKLVFVHGYGGAGVLFFKMYRHLIEHFQVYFVDIIGMAGSSKAGDYSTSNLSHDQLLDYFSDYMERWRQQVGLTKFILAGHSFGGFLVGHYARKYPQYIERLLLLSPIGIKSYSADRLETAVIEREMVQQNPRFAQRRCCCFSFLCVMKCFFNCRISPFGALRCCCCCARSRIDSFV